jgi:glycosyltransferase involved in cell wall biosynthesis
MRVLHVVENAGSGTSRHLVDVTRTASEIEHHLALSPMRHRVLAGGAPYDTAAVAAMVAAGARVHYVDMRRPPANPANLAAVLNLRRLLYQLRPAVVHGHSSVGGALARLAAAGSATPAVYTPHALASGSVAHAVERSLGRVTARLIAVSESEAAEARQLRLAPPERIVAIPNGIDLSPVRPAETDLRAVLGLAPGTPLIGSIARLVPQKAPDEMVALCAAVGRHRPDTHFLHIGMGPLQDRVDSAVARSGIATRWHQISELPDAAATLDQLDVFVLPSRFEGGPYAPLEAMRAGTPVVLSEVVGNKDIVEDGVSGFLVAFGDTEKMAARVISLLEEPERRQAIVAAARERLRTRFDVQVMGARLSDLYREVAGESRRRRTRRLPHPKAPSSAQPPDASAAQYSS